jgi:hypothetical protein
MPIQSRLWQRAVIRSSAHRHNYNVQGFHSASLRCSFWPNWAFNATVVCCRQNRASMCGALTSVLGPQDMLPRIAKIVGLVPAIALAGGCGSLACNIEAVEGAKKLDKEYLSQLYAYAASNECKGTCRPSILSGLSGLGNRAPVFEALPGNQAQVKLSVQLDCGVILTFKELGTPSGAVYVISSTDGTNWDKDFLWSVGHSNTSTVPN